MTTPWENSYPVGVDDESGPILPPWYTRGWTAQNQLTANIPAPPNPFAQSELPVDQNFTVLTQYYFDPDSNPAGGYLTFWPSDAFTITENGQSWRIPQKLAGTLTWPAVDVGVSPWAFSQEGSGKIFIFEGILVVRLFCTDGPNLVTDSGNPLTYHVIEHFLGGRQYDITTASTAASQNLYANIVPGSIQPYNFDPINPLGDQLEGYGPPPVIESQPAIQWLPAVSTDWVTVDVAAALLGSGVSLNLTTDNIYFAFTAPGVDPVSTDWNTAAWVSGGPPFLAEILVGPENNGLVLAKGKYTIWFKIVDVPAVPVSDVGTLYIT